MKFVLAPLMLLSLAAAAQTKTTTTLTVSPQPVVIGQTATAKVQVSAASGTPGGQVQLFVDGEQVATATLTNGQVTLSPSTSPLSPGKYSVTAEYAGSGTYARSESSAVTFSAVEPVVLALYASPTDAQQGVTANLIARVQRANGTGLAGGTVTFFSGSQAFATVPVANNVATVSESTAGLPQGTYSLTARYSGSSQDETATSAVVSVAITPPGDVLTHRYNVQRTGVQNAETTLTPANVNSTSFGALRSFPVDGSLFAQPLFISHEKMSDGNYHNVVYAATSNATIYAFDADGNNPVQGYLWKTSLLGSGETAQAVADYFGCGNPSPASGILGTPVIDRNTNAIYAIAATKITSNSTFVQRLHALNLTDGTEILGGPTVIAASVPGTGAGNSGGMVSFDAIHEAQRAALLETAGQVVISWASHCDDGPYHGWTMAYNAANITQQTAVNNNNPNGSDDGIWMTGGGPSTDNLGNIYTGAGNGTFDVNTGGTDYGNAISRIAFTPAFGNQAASLGVTDWFVPDNQAYLTDHDLDNGMVSPLLIQDPKGPHPNLVVDADKTGVIYLLDRDDMGKYDTGSNGPGALNGDLQEITMSAGTFTNFAWFNNTLYAVPGGGAVLAYQFVPGSGSTTGHFNTTPASQTTFSGSGYPNGLQPVISANAGANAILWVLNDGGNNATLYAVNPANLGTLYYSSTQASGNRDQGPPPVKFVVPTVAGGRVFVGGQNELVEYGLLAQ